MPTSLSPNHELVLKAIKKAKGPLSAYDLLARLKEDKLTAPPTIYRALKRLIQEGLVHRIESLNAYIACACEHQTPLAAFAICDSCGQVSEFPCENINPAIKDWAEKTGFAISQISLELKGRCQACGEKS